MMVVVFILLKTFELVDWLIGTIGDKKSKNKTLELNNSFISIHRIGSAANFYMCSF